MLTIGDRAPDFHGRDQKGEAVSLGDLLSGGPLVLFFYPKAFTPVCTKEACLFEDAHGELQRQGAQVVGVSGDSHEKHRDFVTQYHLSYPQVSDPDHAIARAYGAMQPLGLGTKRVTYVIDQGGIVRGAFHYELRAAKHVQEVRRVLAELA